MWLKAEVEVAAAEMLRLPERDAAAEAVAVWRFLRRWGHGCTVTICRSDSSSSFFVFAQSFT
jgi:hypothetical protein